MLTPGTSPWMNSKKLRKYFICNDGNARLISYCTQMNSVKKTVLDTVNDKGVQAKC